MENLVGGVGPRTERESEKERLSMQQSTRWGFSGLVCRHCFVCFCAYDCTARPFFIVVISIMIDNEGVVGGGRRSHSSPCHSVCVHLLIPPRLRLSHTPENAHTFADRSWSSFFALSPFLFVFCLFVPVTDRYPKTSSRCKRRREKKGKRERSKNQHSHTHIHTLQFFAFLLFVCLLEHLSAAGLLFILVGLKAHTNTPDASFHFPLLRARTARLPTQLTVSRFSYLSPSSFLFLISSVDRHAACLPPPCSSSSSSFL